MVRTKSIPVARVVKRGNVPTASDEETTDSDMPSLVSNSEASVASGDDDSDGDPESDEYTDGEDSFSALSGIYCQLMGELAKLHSGLGDMISLHSFAEFVRKNSSNTV